MPAVGCRVACVAPPHLRMLGDMVAFSQHLRGGPQAPTPVPRLLLFWGRKAAFRRWQGRQREPRPPGLMFGVKGWRGVGVTGPQLSPGCGDTIPAAPRSPWTLLDPLGQARHCPAQDLPLQGCSGTHAGLQLGEGGPPKAPQDRVCRLGHGQRCRSCFHPSLSSSGVCKDGGEKPRQRLGGAQIFGSRCVLDPGARKTPPALGESPARGLGCGSGPGSCPPP